MPFDFNDCIKENLLRKIPPSLDKAHQSIKKSKEWLSESEKSLNGGAAGSSILSSYMSMFHAARSILFFDGYREKVMLVLLDIWRKNMLRSKNWI